LDFWIHPIFVIDILSFVILIKNIIKKIII